VATTTPLKNIIKKPIIMKTTFWKRTAVATGIAALMTITFVSLLVQVPANAQETPRVDIERVPEGGLQPQVMVRGEVVHLLYFKGEPRGGDLFYSRSSDGAATFGRPLRVNSQAGSAIAMGTIRGGQLAVGKDGRVFVVWNGSDKATPRNPSAPASKQEYGASPMLFTRLNDAGNAFEPQRNLMTRTFSLDGGGSVASDEEGHVYVAWHANDKEGQDEDARRVYLAVSNDSGATFAPEKAVWAEPTGACGCCQLQLMAGSGDKVSLLYRSAREMENRDTYYLASSNGGKSFQGQKIHPWRVGTCPMSSYALARSGKKTLAAWESAEQVFFAAVAVDGKAPIVIPAPGSGPNRKHPRLGVAPDGQTLLIWTEESRWNRGGALCWQLFDAQNRPIASTKGKQSGVPAWSFAAVLARPDGTFRILY
jgi:hypothetical protein